MADTKIRETDYLTRLAAKLDAFIWYFSPTSIYRRLTGRDPSPPAVLLAKEAQLTARLSEDQMSMISENLSGASPDQRQKLLTVFRAMNEERKSS